jgi:ATP synthase protein I
MADESNQDSSREKKKIREFFRYLGVISTVGINLVVSTFVGFAIGWVLDKKVFNTFPWLTIIFLLLGIAAGFKYLFKIASKVNDSNSEDRDKKLK